MKPPIGSRLRGTLARRVIAIDRFSDRLRLVCEGAYERTKQALRLGSERQRNDECVRVVFRPGG